MRQRKSGVFFYGDACSFISKLMALLILIALSSQAQDAPLRFQIAVGQSQAAITAACGKPFEKSREDDSSFNASVGVPLGLWSVYHLTPFEDRMFVTLAHFDPNAKVDSLMLMPAGNSTVTQILKDHPSMAQICAASCELIQVPEKAGNTSLLLKPKSPSGQERVIFFIGDTGSRYKSITAMDSIVSWGYVLQLSDFEKHHPGVATKTVGEWSP